MPFPSDFVWGAATSSYQIEGAWSADGKGPSNWDDFCHRRVPMGFVGDIAGQVFTPGNVFHNHTGDVACDHYNRYREDVAIMKEIGLRAYRFSISWPRVVPHSAPGQPGEINAKGLDFYSRLVDELLAAGVRPWVTLFHWDMPLWMWRRGAWRNREVVDRFAEYARAVVDRLSDRVTNWMTINEPQIFLGPSEFEGLQTENARRSHHDRLLAAHHTLLAHGRAVQVIRDFAKSKPSIGWAPIGRVKVPASSPGERTYEADVGAARAATLATLKRDFWTNAWFADPIVFGHYPEDGLRLYGHDAPDFPAADMALINQPTDFYGINVYDAERFRACSPHHANPLGPTAPYERVDFPPGHARTAIGWFICPEALYWGPKFLYERYKKPIVVTENGLSNTDWVDADGQVRDPQRIDYTRAYLRNFRRAGDEGAHIAGYFHWSLLDNMEWQQGYNQRFGLVHVDFATQKRTLKDSARWYAQVIRTHGSNL